jgi:hypothetical protein
VKKIAQTLAQPRFFIKTNAHANFTGEKSSPQVWSTTVVFKKLPKVNNSPIGEKSSNLVTLVPSKLFCFPSPYPTNVPQTRANIPLGIGSKNGNVYTYMGM